MEFAALKPWLTALIMPPASLLLLAALAWLVAKRWRRTGWVLGLGSLGALWLLATQACAAWLAAALLPSYTPLSPAQIAALPSAAGRVGAPHIVVLAGGIEPHSPDYGGLDLNPASYARLRYGYYLKSLTGLPLGYSGGSGWSSRGAADVGLGAALQATLRQDGRAPLDWVEDASRDTHENAVFTARLLRPRGVKHVVLVTHAWHMPRSVRAFEAAGLRVTPAPMGALRGADNWQQHWLPSGLGLQGSYSVLREYLGLRMGAY